MGEVTANYELYKGRNAVARIALVRGQFHAVTRVYDRSLLPPYFWGENEEQSATRLLRQFFHFRFLSPQSPYYNLGKEMQREAYISLFDDYHLAVTPLPYDLQRYQLAEDPFFLAIRDGNGNETSDVRSPNLCLFYPNLCLFEVIDGTRYLLMEYSKQFADMQKRAGIPYTIQIRADIPFLSVRLPQGELYPLPAICSPELSLPQLEIKLREITPTFSFDTCDPDYCVLAVNGDKREVVML